MKIHHKKLHGNLKRSHKTSPLYPTRRQVLHHFREWNKSWKGGWRCRVVRVVNHAGALLGYAAVCRPSLSKVR